MSRGLSAGVETSDEPLSSEDPESSCAVLALGGLRWVGWWSRVLAACSARVGAARPPLPLGTPLRLGGLREGPGLSTGVEASDEPLVSEYLASGCGALSRGGSRRLDWLARGFPVCSVRGGAAWGSRLWRMYRVAISAVEALDDRRLGGPPPLLVRCSEGVEAVDELPLGSEYLASGSATLTRDGSRRCRRSSFLLL